MSEWHLNPVGNYQLVAVVAALFLALLVFFGPDASRLPARRRRVLAGLRVAIFLAIVAGLLRPTHVFTEMKRHRATLIVLVDRSRSMSIADEPGKTRWQALRDEVQRALPAFRQLNDDLDVKFYTFDAGLTPVDLTDGKFDLGDTADGRQTAIGAALDDALRKEAGHRLAGVILLSDGAQSAIFPRDEAPQLPVRRLADLGAPLYTITFGKIGGQLPDVAVSVLDVSPSVYVKNELAIRGTVRVSGYDGKPIPVQALFEVEPGKPLVVVGTTTVHPTKSGEEIPVEFTYIPQTAGERKVSLAVPPQENEQDITNNEMSSFVKVFGGGLNVLYLEGEPRVEQRFLRRSFATSPDIKVDFLWLDHRQHNHWPVDLADRFKPGKYDVYIIGDLDSAAFRREDLQSLREAVEHGAGLILTGGFHSFAAGGYPETPLADILPLEVGELDKLDRQSPDFNDPIRDKLHIWPTNPSEGIKMLPDRRFGDVSVMRLGPRDRNRAIWEKLPGLEGANLFRALKPSAKPIAVTPDGKPLLVAAEPGSGRVLCFAGDSTWHWCMAGFEKEHKQFWRQVVLWLAKKEDSDKPGVWIKMAQRQLTPGRPVDFTVGATSPQGEPLPDATFEAVAELPGGVEHPIHLSRQGNRTIGRFAETQLVGDYTIRVRGTDGGSEVGEARARFIVYDRDLEMENPAPRPSLMISLARMTADSGGRAVAPEELSALCEQLKQRPHDLEVPVETKTTPWDTPWFFLLIVGLLTVEWYLRKKWGLV